MSNGDSNKNSVLIAYICYIAGLLVPLTPIAGVIINHIKRDEVRGTWLESHHRWMMRTFWFSFMWSIIASIAMIIPIVNVIAMFAMLAIAIWYIYRIVRGFINYNDEKGMYGETAGTQVQSEGAGA